MFDVILSNQITFKNECGELIDKQMGEIYVTEDYDGSFGFNTGEEGWMGVTQTLGIAPNKYNSPDNSVKIVVNSKLSERGVVESQETNLPLKDAITNATKETIKNMSE